MLALISKVSQSLVSRSFRQSPAAVKAEAAPVAAAPMAALVVAPMAVEELEGRRLCSSSLAYGINANAITGSSYGKILGMLRDTGTKTVRLWLNVNSYNSRSETGIFKYIRRFSNDGIDTTVTVDPPHSGSYDSIKDCFAWLGDKLGDSVDRWQVGNEVDREFGNLHSYVDNILAPAAAGLHSVGEKVVSGSVSWNPDDIRTMVNDGMLGMVDAVGYHPYTNSVENLKKNVAEVKDVINGKPLIATEWNVRGDEGNSGAWNDEIKDFWPTIRDNFYAAYYYAAIKSGTMAGGGAVLSRGGGSANGEFYSTYKGLKNNFNDGGGQTTPTPPTDGNDGQDQGNAPDASTNTKPTVSAFRIYSGNTSTVLSGYNSVTGNLTIKLSDLKGKSIQMRALTSSNAGSVKFSFTGRKTRVENTAPWTVFGNSKNQATAWTPKKGTYTLKATAFTQDNAKGMASVTKTIVIKFV